MNTNQKINRKAALEKSLANGKPFHRAIAPGEFLELVAHTDPLNFERGLCMLQTQVKGDEDRFLDYQIDHECYESALDVARNTLFMDSVRAKLNRFKYENGLIADDEILAFALFLIADSDLVAYAADTGEVEFDDLGNLINHMANRIKFLLMCMHDGRYDMLNLVIQHARRNKSNQIDTLFCFDTVEPDDGGAIDFFYTLMDSTAFEKKLDYDAELCEAAIREREKMEKILNDEDYDEDDDEFDNDDQDEPLVERDFEG